MASIVRIQELELHALQELRAESLREGHKFIERLCEEWASGKNRFSARGEALFLAFADGRAIGVCGLNCDPYAGVPQIGRVRRLYVMRAHRRVGVGRALLVDVIAFARCHYRRLRVRTDAANDFYIAQGFRRIATDAETTHVLELTPLPNDAVPYP
jgi:GNAT superfamily N-acetyltransferase